MSKVKALDPSLPKSSKAGIEPQHHSHPSEFFSSWFILVTFFFYNPQWPGFLKGDQQQAPRCLGLHDDETKQVTEETLSLSQRSSRRCRWEARTHTDQSLGPCFSEQDNLLSNVDILHCKQTWLKEPRGAGSGSCPVFLLLSLPSQHSLQRAGVGVRSASPGQQRGGFPLQIHITESRSC